MKKILSLIIIVAVMLIAFAGCATPVGSTLQSRWQHLEEYTYEVKRGEDIVGTFTFKSIRVTNDNVVIGDKTYNNVTGTRINYELTFNNSDNTVLSEVFFNPRFSPLYSYKRTVKGEDETVISAYYTNKEYIYTLNKNGEESAGKVKTKAPYYDNEMIYYALRSTDMSIKNYTFTYNVPSPIEGKSLSVNAKILNKTTLNGIMGKDIEAYEMLMAANLKIPADAYKLYYAVSDVEAEGGLMIKTPLIKLIEGEFTYTLVSLYAELKPTA